MAHVILADTVASIAELIKDPVGTVAAGEGAPVVIISQDQPAFYCVPVDTFAALLEQVEDRELNAIADARKDEQPIKVDVDAL